MGYFCGGKIFMDFMVHTSISYYYSMRILFIVDKSKMGHVLCFNTINKDLEYRRL